MTCEHAEFDELWPVQVPRRLGLALLAGSFAYMHQCTRRSPCTRNAQRARGVDAARVPAPMSHGLRWPALPPSWRILLAAVAVIVLVGAIVLVCRPREGTAPALPPRHRTRRRRFLSAPSSSRPLTIAAVMNTMGGGAHDALAVTAARNPRRVLMTGFRTIKAIRRWLTTPATADFRRPGRFRLMLVPAADCPQRSFSLMVRWQPLVRLATRCDNRGCRCPSRSPPTLPT